MDTSIIIAAPAVGGKAIITTGATLVVLAFVAYVIFLVYRRVSDKSRARRGDLKELQRKLAEADAQHTMDEANQEELKRLIRGIYHAALRASTSEPNLSRIIETMIERHPLIKDWIDDEEKMS